MALTYTPPGTLGQRLPSFTLPTVDGKNFSSAQLKSDQAVCVMFICNHCPYVKAIEDRLLDLARELEDQAQFIAICSNDSTDFPEDAPAALLQRSLEKNYPFPYLVDGTQAVAKNFGAVCTPDLYVFDRTHRLSYRGRLDDSWRNPALVNNQDLKEALLKATRSEPAPEEQIPSMGCSIKWKA